MSESIKVRVQHRRRTARDWNTSDDVLLEGELGIETDTGKVKVGNGRSRFNQLKYIGEDVYVKISDLDSIIERKLDDFKETIQGQLQAPPSRPEGPVERPEAVMNEGIRIVLGEEAYVLTVEQAVKLAILVEIVGNDVSKINKVLSNTDVGVSTGVKSITNANFFKRSKANIIARKWIETNSSSVPTIRSEINGAIKQVG